MKIQTFLGRKKGLQLPEDRAGVKKRALKKRRLVTTLGGENFIEQKKSEKERKYPNHYRQKRVQRDPLTAKNLLGEHNTAGPPQKTR